MNPRAVHIAVIACAVLGGWLPSLWLARDAPDKRALPGTSLTVNAVPAPPDWRVAARSARTPMAFYRAVFAGVAERGDSSILQSRGLVDLGCAEAEELACCLAADAAGRRAKDGRALMKSLEDFENYDARGIALRAWAAAQPEAALTALLEPDGMDMAHAGSVLQSLAARDPDKTLALLKAADAKGDRHEAWQAVLLACAERGPEFALAAIQSVPEGVRFYGLNALLQNLAAKDPREALRRYEAFPPEYHGLASTFEVFKVWAEQDPATAFQEWIARHPRVDDGVGYEMAKYWSAKDPDALFQWALAHRDIAGRSLELATKAMALRDPKHALQMVEQTPAGVHNPLLLRNLLWNIGESWVESDAGAALTWVRTLPEDRRSYVLVGMLPNLRTLPAEELRTVAQDMGVHTPHGFRTLMSVDRAGAESVLAALPPEQSRALCWDMIPLADSRADAGRFLDAFLRFPPAPVSGEATPETVADDSLPAGETPLPDLSLPFTPGPVPTPVDLLSTRVAELTAAWTAEDPAAAAAWVAQLPPGEPQSVAAANLAYTWARYDLPAARTWVEQLPVGEPRDKAAEQITRIQQLSGE